MRFVHFKLRKNSENYRKAMDGCGKNQEKILRLQFKKILSNKKVIEEISDLLENFIWSKSSFKKKYVTETSYI